MSASPPPKPVILATPAGAQAVAANEGADGQHTPANYKWQVQFVVGASLYMSTLSAGIVNVVLPVLTRDFASSLVLTQWVVLGYLLCVVGLLLPAGRLADVVGRREVFIAGLLLFGAASALCGLAPSLAWLIAARVFQGVGAALVQANTGALVTQAVPANERGRALGINGSMVSLGLLSGPLVGGVIAEHFGWRWAFYVNVPVSAFAAVMSWRLLRPSPVTRDQRFDPAGALLFLAATVSLLFGLNRGSSWGWSNPRTFAVLAAAAASTAAFIWVERRVAQPTVDLTLFRNRAFSAAAAAGFLSFTALASVVLLMPFYFQIVLGLRADQSGLLLTTQVAAVALLSPVSGTLSDKFGSQRIASLGLLLESVGLATLIFLPVRGDVLWAAARLVLVGIGVAFFQSPNGSALYGSVPPSRLGLVGGFQALTRNLGQSVGQVVAGVLWSAATLASAAGVAGTAIEAPPEAMMAGFRMAFAWSCGIALIALLISVFGRPRTLAAVSPSSPPQVAGRLGA